MTTCEDMQDPVPPELGEVYASAGATFAYVGPLLDQHGARRAAGHRFAQFGHGPAEDAQSHQEAMRHLARAREAGCLVVLASMGTVITGDSPDFGWAVKPVESQRQGLTGKQLCQAAWSGVFDAFGVKDGDSAEKAPLILVSVGPQKDALDGVEVPSNAVCMPALPQVRSVAKHVCELFDLATTADGTLRVQVPKYEVSTQTMSTSAGADIETLARDLYPKYEAHTQNHS